MSLRTASRMARGGEISRIGLIVKYWKAMPSAQAAMKSQTKLDQSSEPRSVAPVAKMANSVTISASAQPAPQWVSASATCCHLSGFGLVGLFPSACLPHAAGVHLSQGLPGHLPALPEVQIGGENTEVQRSNRPDEIHDPHLLWMPELIRDDENGAGKCQPERKPGKYAEHVTSCRIERCSE